MKLACSPCLLHRWHLLALGLLAGTCVGAQAASTLIFCSEGSPEGFDPARYTAGTTFNASSQPLFNRLVEFERGGTRVEPGLAEKWTVSPDGLVYTFTLRKGVKFHTTEWFRPTRDLNADDVIFSFDRMVNKDNAFLANLAMDFASIQSAEYAAQLLKAGTPGDFNTKPVGTGPFVFRRYEKDAQIRRCGCKSSRPANARCRSTRNRPRSRC